ncbi:hypothetical protein PIB30_007897 [Stylosanthes scabra]|uniref:Uncharacterized protein n=1 Tax=Stylosanthes scabra TaxID=79078 RepID=A0ABU6R5V4_9FABA|nr:hypothetical protein [Stylosanthes scabra]
MGLTPFRLTYGTEAMVPLELAEETNRGIPHWLQPPLLPYLQPRAVKTKRRLQDPAPTPPPRQREVPPPPQSLGAQRSSDPSDPNETSALWQISPHQDRDGKLGRDKHPTFPNTSPSPQIQEYATPSASIQMPRWPYSGLPDKSSTKQLETRPAPPRQPPASATSPKTAARTQTGPSAPSGLPPAVQSAPKQIDALVSSQTARPQGW